MKHLSDAQILAQLLGIKESTAAARLAKTPFNVLIGDKIEAVQEAASRYRVNTFKAATRQIEAVWMAKDLVADMRNMEHEEFHVLYLNNKHGLISRDVMGLGTVDKATVHPREVLKAALKHNASAVIFAHNHPSGVTAPSQADHRITEKLTEGLKLVDIRVLDHFIVGSEDIMSFAEAGYL